MKAISFLMQIIIWFNKLKKKKSSHICTIPNIWSFQKGLLFKLFLLIAVTIQLHHYFCPVMLEKNRKYSLQKKYLVTALHQTEKGIRGSQKDRYWATKAGFSKNNNAKQAQVMLFGLSSTAACVHHHIFQQFLGLNTFLYS